MDRFRGLPTVRILDLEVPVAVSPRARLLGLALLDRADAPGGLLIPRCRSIHTFGMRFALDVAFLADGGLVIEIRRGVGPLRLARCAAADAVLEIPAPGPLIPASGSRLLSD